MIKNLLLSLSFILLFSSASAQTIEEALRISDKLLGGTARGVATANAFGAVGADFAAANINPAGMGLYRSSEFMITPAFELSNNESVYINNRLSDGINKFQIESFGVVFSREIEKSDWKFRNIGIGYLVQNKFYDSYTVSAENPDNSFMDYYANQASGLSPEYWVNNDPLGIGLFYEGYIINPLADNNYGSVAGPGLRQTEIVSTDRSQREFNVSMSGNFKDKLYLGAALAFPNYKYDIVNTLSEEDSDDIYNTFESYNYVFEESTEGDGINLKVGIIYRIINPLRLGLSIQTRSSYDITTYYNTELQSRLEGSLQGFSDNYASPDGVFSYNLTSPFIVTGSAMYMFNRGFLSMDYEFIDHSTTEYSVSEENQDDEIFLSQINEDIFIAYQSASKLRIGAEIAPQQMRYRAGVIIKSSPYIVDGSDLSIIYSAGLGYRFKSAALDLGYRYLAESMEHLMYFGTDPAEVDLKHHSLLLSLAFRF